MNPEATLENFPQYADEVNALYGMPIFQNDRLTEEDALSDQCARSLLYTAGLRILAEYRSFDRQTMGPEPDEDIAEWNRDWMPGVKGLRSIGDENTYEVEQYVRRLAMLNNFEAFMQACGGEDPVLWPDQQETMMDILKFVRSGGRRIVWPDDDGGQYEAFVHGVLAKDPTGSGKTVVMARTATALGIGRPVDANEAESRLRMLIVAPSRAIVKQIAGDRGDDTFRRNAPGMTVSPYYESSKDKSGDVVVTTTNQFIEKFRDGMLDGERFDILAFDEVHHLTSPMLFSTFRDNWHGTTVGFTATPHYNPSKDVRLILPFDAGGHSTIELIRRGRLNAAQLLTFKSSLALQGGPELREVASQSEKGNRDAEILLMERGAVELAARLMAEGRRGIIFTNPGDQSASARRVAWQLQQEIKSIGDLARPVRVEALGFFRTLQRLTVTNDDILHAYDSGEVDALVSVDQGRQGLNADIDFVIVATPIGSLLKLEQIIGRGTRRSQRFPTTVYAQFLPGNGYYSYQGTYRPRTVFEVFGVEENETGIHHIGARDKDKDRGKDGPNFEEDRGFNIDKLPPGLLEQLAVLDTSTRHEVTIENGQESEFVVDQEGRMRFDDLEAVRLIGKVRTMRILDAQRVNWTGHIERVDGVERMTRWYDPAEIGDLLKFASPTDMSKRDISRMADVGDGGKEFWRLVSEEEWSAGSMKRPLDKKGGMQRYWSEEDGLRIAERLKKRASQLPPNLMPRNTIPDFIDVKYMTLVGFLKRQQIPAEMIRLKGSKAGFCVEWDVVRMLADTYGMLPGAPEIEFDRLPKGMDDDDEDRILYARAVQLSLMQAKRLGLDDETLAQARQLAQTLQFPQIDS